MSMNFLQVISKAIRPQRFTQYKENYCQVTKLIHCSEPETQNYGKNFNLLSILFQLVQKSFQIFHSLCKTIAALNLTTSIKDSTAKEKVKLVWTNFISIYIKKKKNTIITNNFI